MIVEVVGEVEARVELIELPKMPCAHLLAHVILFGDIPLRIRINQHRPVVILSAEVIVVVIVMVNVNLS